MEGWATGLEARAPHSRQTTASVPPEQLGGGATAEDRAAAYRSYRVRIVVAVRVALRAGADGTSVLESLMSSLLQGNARSHLTGLQQAWSGLLRDSELLGDGPLLLNAALAIADSAFTPSTAGAKDGWRNMKRAHGEPLSLTASSIEEYATRLHAPKTTLECYSSKSIRSDIYDKLLSVIRNDDHEERKMYADALGDYASETLNSLSAAYELSPTPENLQKLTLTHAVTVHIAPREETLLRELKLKFPRKYGSRNEQWRTRWEDEERSSRRAREPRYARVAAVRDTSGADTTDDEESSGVAYINKPNKDKENRKDTRNNEQRKTTYTREPPSGNDILIDFRKLMGMNHLEARQAWPVDAALTATAQEFVIKPIDRTHNIWPTDACKHCAYYLKQDGAHPAARCPKLMKFIKDRSSLRECLVTRDELRARRSK